MHLAHRQPYLAPTSFMVCAEIRLRLAVVVLGRGALFYPPVRSGRRLGVVVFVVIVTVFGKVPYAAL